MKRSDRRILTSHSGALPKMVQTEGDPSQVREAVSQVVRKQLECGIDIINDGEQGKTLFSTYVITRLDGIEHSPGDATIDAPSGRDMRQFPGYFSAPPRARHQFPCTGPLKYAALDQLREDIAALKEALQGVSPEEVFLTSVAPATLEHWIENSYYPSEADFVEALSNTMAEEYRAIVDAGFILQLDNPDLVDGWGIQVDASLPEYRKAQEMRVEALNAALEAIPEDRIRVHTCWGAYRGPHTNDLPLRDMLDIIFKTKAQCYSVEASNPRHLSDWRVYENIRLPDGKILMPGVVGHFSDHVEHPEVVADRIVQYANIVGRENVIAGTDCGLSGNRVGQPAIAWAKLEALSQGAALASRQLWS